MSDGGATIDLPGAGPVKKVYVYVGLAVVVGIVGYAWWTRRNTSADGETSYVEPGYEDYGGGVQTPGGGTTTPGIPWQPGEPVDEDDPATPITNNAQWTRRAVNYLTEQGSDGFLVTVTLGKYLARVELTAAEADLVRAALGAIGAPPNGEYRVIVTGTPQTPVPPAAPVTPAAPEFVSVPLNENLYTWINGLNAQYPGLGLSWNKYVSMNDLDGENRKYWHWVSGHPEFFQWHKTLGIPALRIR